MKPKKIAHYSDRLSGHKQLGMGEQEDEKEEQEEDDDDNYNRTGLDFTGVCKTGRACV